MDKEEIKMDDLARIVQDGFLSMEERFKSLEDNIKEVKSDTGDIKADLNKKVDVFVHKELEFRVEKVEEGLKLKQKIKFA